MVFPSEVLLWDPPKLAQTGGIVPNDTKRCAFIEATKYQKHKRKYLKNQNFQKTILFVIRNVHKIMLTKYEVLTRIQLRYLECTKWSFTLKIGSGVSGSPPRSRPQWNGPFEDLRPGEPAPIRVAGTSGPTAGAGRLELLTVCTQWGCESEFSKMFGFVSTVTFAPSVRFRSY